MLKIKNCTVRYFASLLVLMAFGLDTVNCYANNSALAPRASAKSVKHEEIVKISDQIDSLVLAKLKDEGIDQNPLASDEIFLRRIYLDVVGRIPTLQETKAFLDSKSKTKRADLIDELLDSYGFVSHQFNFLADVLRVQTRANRVVGQPYIDFIKDSLESNMPYDEFVVELLSAEGKMLDPESRAVGYYLRDLNMPEDNMSNTVRVFLGTRLECAQCHDHPYDKWTQRDYFEMVAFTGGINYGQGKKDILKNLNAKEKQKLQEMRESKDEGYFRLRRYLSTSQMGIFGSGTGLARLPEGFMGSDGEENEIVVGKTMFEKEALVDAVVPNSTKSKSKQKKKARGQKNIKGAKDVGSRKAYAQWLTSEENPRFATTIANRLWKQAFGMALIEPVDVIEDNTEASNEELMAYLTDVMIELQFDRKQFLRAIYNSRSYQSVATATDVLEPLTHAFNGPLVRRMSAEQIWDSLLALTVPDTDRRANEDSNTRMGKINELIAAFSNGEEGALDNLLDFVSANSKEKGGMFNAAKQAAKNRGREMRDTMRSLNRKIRDAQKSGNDVRVKSLMLERAEKVQTLKSDISGKYSRASELVSPAPAGHFLRQFGQSDRDQIENSNRDPAVPQILSMMNGMIEKQIVKDPNTVLMSNLLKMQASQGGRRYTDRADPINTIFLTMLNREPTRSERRQWGSDIRSDFKSAYGDLIWTLANSNEFIFLK